MGPRTAARTWGRGPVVECRFRLDGGAMFGVVPRTLWSRTAPADENNRIRLCCRVLIVQVEGHLAVIDAGMGECWGGDPFDLPDE